jgi:hypothetical protein
LLLPGRTTHGQMDNSLAVACDYATNHLVGDRDSPKRWA